MSVYKARKMPLKSILQSAIEYGKNNAKMVSQSVIIAYVLGALALFSWKSIFFWPIIALIYVVWGMFFRIYFKVKPYFEWKSLLNSLIPSTKIIALSLIVGTILILLPLVPLFFNLPSEFMEKYSKMLQGELNQQAMLGFCNLFFILLSPMLLYRPFLAWISILLGEYRSLRLVWNRTKRNYWNFVIIAIITNLATFIFREVVLIAGGNDFVTMIFMAPIIIYFNIVSAKAYEFFFVIKK